MQAFAGLQQMADGVTWPPFWGPKPDYKYPDECPPKENEYYAVPGGYAFWMFAAGCVPMLGGFGQELLTKPATCANANVAATSDIRFQASQWQDMSQKNLISEWNLLEGVLGSVRDAGLGVADLLSVSVWSQLMYLLAGLVSLILLVSSIVLSI